MLQRPQIWKRMEVYLSYWKKTLSWVCRRWPYARLVLWVTAHECISSEENQNIWFFFPHPNYKLIFSRGYEIQKLQITFIFVIRLNFVYSLVPSGDFCAPWFPIPRLGCLSSELFVEKIMCYSEIFAVLTSCQDDFPEVRGLISLLGYNRWLLSPD